MLIGAFREQGRAFLLLNIHPTDAYDKQRERFSHLALRKKANEPI